MTALVIAGMTALTLAACGDDEPATPESSKETSKEKTSTSEVAVLPSAKELNDLLMKVTDGAAPIEERTALVETGEEMPDLFPAIVRPPEGGPSFNVIEPVMPGFTADSALAGVDVNYPDQEPQRIEGVEFMRVDGKWRLSKVWACTLAQTMSPDSVPPVCAPEGEVPAPPAEEQPPAEVPPVEAPAPEAPPAPEEPAPEAPPAPPAPEAPAPEAPPAPPAPEAPAPEAPPAPPADAPLL
ncbi:MULTISPECIES: hypothetical protein [unclassified Corynebacterium]|uniref:hypothetical protein n=1 Tax=unclassified Corynebacterium TaxID=2624378 RepID=UPI0030B778E9